MDCKETEKMIPLFLTKQLTNKELNIFLIHVEDCAECMEELTIQYLVMVGTSMIEEGKSFDLRKALNGLLSDARVHVKKWKIYTRLSYVAEIITWIVMAIIIVTVVLI